MSGSENGEASRSGVRLTVSALVVCSALAVGLVATAFVALGLDLSFMFWLRRVEWVFWPTFWVVMTVALAGLLGWAEKRRLPIELLMVGGMLVGWASGVVGFGLLIAVSDGEMPRNTGLFDVVSACMAFSYLSLTWVHGVVAAGLAGFLAQRMRTPAS